MPRAMEIKKKDCCVLIYNSFNDPLFQNIMYQYMRSIHKSLGWTFHLITFEQCQYSLTDQEKSVTQKHLSEDNIKWYPKTHHTGKFLLIKKLYDFISVFFILLKLRLSGVQVIWSFANVAASISWVYSKLLGFKTIIYSYEPHSAFMAELGLWSTKSLKYKLLNFLEEKAGQDSDFILTGTKYMVNELQKKGSRSTIYRAPTSVDENDFVYRKDGRNIINTRHNLHNTDKIILYIGKFGDLYYTWQIPLLFKLIHDNITDTKFIVISPNPYNEIEGYFNHANFDIRKIIYLTKIPYDEIKNYISASNMGVSAVPPTPSQKYRSPTKVAEYLLCGLPYITCKGVSEDDIIAQEYGVGVVLEDFTEKSILTAIPQITSFLELKKPEISQNCRNAGLAYRSKRNVDLILNGIFNKLV